jgi:hypothetical protein
MGAVLVMLVMLGGGCVQLKESAPSKADDVLMDTVSVESTDSTYPLFAEFISQKGAFGQYKPEFFTVVKKVPSPSGEKVAVLFQEKGSLSTHGFFFIINGTLGKNNFVVKEPYHSGISDFKWENENTVSYNTGWADEVGSYETPKKIQMKAE